ncbi:MAG: T9SS type A sorting domain-containing protein [Caldithrix sp.]|nr:T9SS type A sorting domain-containing protein [Caldithrix sp.]
MRTGLTATLVALMLWGGGVLKARNMEMKQGNGLTGYYYQQYTVDSTGIIVFDGLTEAFSRIDTTIAFWDQSAYYRWQPVSGYGDDYSVQWKGYIYIETAGAYGFGTISDDGSQVFIDSQLVVDNGEKQWFDWEDNISEGDTSNTPFTPLVLDSGFHEISIGFYEDRAYDGIELWWFKPGPDTSDIPYYGDNFNSNNPTYNPNTTWEIVPKAVLYTSLDSVTAIAPDRRRPLWPQTVKLLPNYPNPFNPGTVIRYRVETSGPAPVQLDLSIYNPLGQRLATLVSGKHTDGVYEVEWDGRGYAGGVYFCVLKSGSGVLQTTKLILLK